MRIVSRSTAVLPDLGPRGEGWVAIQVAVIVAVLASAGLLGGRWTGEVRTAAIVVGTALALLGVAMFALGARELGRAFSIWMRPTGQRVVDTGIYGLVRHPICGGQILIGLGVALIATSWVALALAVVLAGLVALKSRHEETMIERRLPDYAAYRDRVRHALIPGLA